MNCPLGFLKSLEIFAKNLLFAMPAEAVRPRSNKMVCLIFFAKSVALPSNSVLPVTSRYASSNERGSILSVKRRKIS